MNLSDVEFERTTYQTYGKYILFWIFFSYVNILLFKHWQSMSRVFSVNFKFFKKFLITGLFFTALLPLPAQIFHPTELVQGTNLGGCMINSCKRMYYDNGGPSGNYSNNIGFIQEGEYYGVIQTLCPDQPGSCISVTFNSFRLAPGDALFIVDSPLEGPSKTYSGNELQGQTITASNPSGCLTFHFYTDGFGNAEGWEAEINCVLCSEVQQNVVNFDCRLAQPVCNEVDQLTGNSAGPGLISEGCDDASCIISEAYSNWYIFRIARGGTLGLEITPTPFTADYDFALFRPANPDDICNIGTALRCSYAFGTGPTGMRGGELSTSEDAGGSPWVNTIEVTTNQTYVLLINQNHFDPSTFVLNWTGSARIGSPDIQLFVKGSDEPLGNQLMVCKGSNLSLEAAHYPGASYRWKFPDGSTLVTNNSLLDSIMITEKTLGTYSVSYTINNGCAGIEKVFELVSPVLESPTAQVNSPICGAGSALLTASGCSSPGIIQWFDAERGGTEIFLGESFKTPVLTESRFYYVSCAVDACYSPRVALEVTVNKLNSTLQNRNDFGKFGISCTGFSDGSIQVIPNGGEEPYRFVWNNGASSAQLDSLPAGTYVVTVTDRIGCSVTDSIELLEPPPIQFDLNISSPNCYPENIGKLIIENISGSAGIFEISIADKDFQAINSFPLTISDLLIGDYQLIIKDQNGCTLKVPVNILAPRILELELSKSKNSSVGKEIQLSASVNFPFKDITWFPESNLSCIDCLNPIADPIESTLYRVTIEDSLGCRITDSILIVVETLRDVYIPTAFSPNQDGINDIFMVSAGNQVREIRQFQIFNRWGSLIYERENFAPNDPVSAWDGTQRGIPLNPDVFIYYLKIEFTDGKEDIFMGSITLLK